ncbi:hypothetical protein Tco_0420234, partial [Tanacetum coccineum]
LLRLEEQCPVLKAQVATPEGGTVSEKRCGYFFQNWSSCSQALRQITDFHQSRSYPKAPEHLAQPSIS